MKNHIKYFKILEVTAVIVGCITVGLIPVAIIVPLFFQVNSIEMFQVLIGTVVLGFGLVFVALVLVSKMVCKQCANKQ